MSNKKLYLLLGIFAVIFTFFGGTLSYWQWNTLEEQQTVVNFTIEDNFSCAVDGGGDITSSDVELAPASCMNSQYAIQRTITASTNITGIDTNVSMDLWLDVKSIDPELSQSANFKYALTSSPDSCTEGVLESGTFTGKSANSTALILDNKIFTASGSETYYLYIWLDSVEENQNTMDKNFNLELNGNCVNIPVVETTYTESILNGADPVLEDGMIPVVIADNGDVVTADLNNEWYNYSNKEWANAILVNSTSRVNYYESDMTTIKANVPVDEEDILAYYVWIPRYKYKVWLMDGTTTSSPQTIDIVFENSGTPKSVATQVGEYYTHPAFTFGNQELDGIWVGKFETTGTSDTPTILPNVSPLVGYDPNEIEDVSANEMFDVVILPYHSNNKLNSITNLAEDTSLTTLSDYFEVSLKFAGGRFDSTSGNVSFSNNELYGITANTDSHMMKNSEWGAVAYLSHSQYGVNQEIYINNYYYEETITGCGALTVDGSETSNCGIEYGIPSSEENVYPQSTTGNISGIFDMSGGVWEYVMGVFNDLSNDESGFSVLPNNKYFDLYEVDSNSSCTLEICGGDALYEIVSWNDDYNNFIYLYRPWFIRGGSYFGGATAGIFSSYFSYGLTGATVHVEDEFSYEKASVFGFRSVLVNEG